MFNQQGDVETLQLAPFVLFKHHYYSKVTGTQTSYITFLPLDPP